MVTMSEPTESPLADLLACLGAFGRSLEETFDPQRFLTEFSARAQRLVAHDRMSIFYLDDTGRTFTVFAEDPGTAAATHAGRYTTDFDPGGRYAVDDSLLADLRPVFAGGVLIVEDAGRDPRFVARPAARRRVMAVGIRSGLAVPIYASGRVVGAFGMSSVAPGVYGVEDVAVCRQIADVIGPFVENVVLFLRERRRRARLKAVAAALVPILGASLKLGDLLERLGDALRSVLDFDAMGIRMSPDGGTLNIVGARRRDGGPRYEPVAPDDYSTSERLALGETVIIHDAERELDPSRRGDALILESGPRSVLIVPLRFGDRIEGYAYFGKRSPDWYDDGDVEVIEAVSAALVIAVQHQRLAEEQQRAAAAEAKAHHLQARVDSLRTALDDRYDFSRIAGRAPAFLDAVEQARKVAPTDATVLLTGESGTGKEIVARAIHHASRRGEGPFVAINCAALPEALIESELFGHERGAFTGADKLKRGRFELASGGTLFLDELAEMAPAAQVKLLRVLQERQYERVGGTATLDADVRLIAATNRDLEQTVAEGRIREDLYYRLAVFHIHLPPLRERGNDVLLLAEHFVLELGLRMGKGSCRLSGAARDALLTHRWPGNIRELQNAIERALIVSDGTLISAEQLGISPRRHAPAEPQASSPLPSSTAASPRSETPSVPSLADLEKRAIAEALARANGNKSRAAAVLGLTRFQLYARLKRFGLTE
jgi:transcriptional regulator with GAF, ATPase, and Fis domain